MMTDEADATPRVIGGVDTHKDVHVAAVLDELGRLLNTASFDTTAVGYRDLYRSLCGRRCRDVDRWYCLVRGAAQTVGHARDAAADALTLQAARHPRDDPRKRTDYG